MADPIGSAAGTAQAFSKDVQDLTARLDELARKFQTADLSKLLKLDKVSDDMQKFMHAVNGTTAAQQKMHRVEKELERVYEKTRQTMLKLAKQKKELDDLGKNQKLTALEKVRHKDLKESLVDEGKQLAKIKKLRTPEKIKELSDEFDKEEDSMKTANIQAFVMKKAFEVLKTVFVGVYNWTEKLQKNLAVLSERFGTSTDAILHMAQVSKQEFLSDKGLGSMGYQLEEITQKLGDFREQLEFTGKITDEQALSLIKYGMAVGVSAQQTGEFSRAIVIMGGDAQDTTNFLLDVGIAAKKSGVTAAALSKQFLSAGKSLFELTGPKARQALTQSAAFLAKLGTGLDKLKGFTDLTDSFDKTAEAAGALNSVFGTSINALELFDEQDPAKRWEMVVNQMRKAGMTPDMIRQEKKFLMDKLQISEETANAGLRAAEEGKDLSKVLEEQANIEKERLETQQKFDEVLERGKKVLIAWAQLSAAFFDNMNSTGMIKSLKTTFDLLMDFVKSDAMGSMMNGLGEAFTIISDIVNVALWAIKPIAKIVFGVVGVLLQGLGYVWKIIKAIVGEFVDLGADDVKWKDLGEASDRMGKGAAGAVAPIVYGLDKMSGGSASAAASVAGTTSPDDVQMFADGGRMRAKRSSLVGERGPELFTPGSGGTITSNEDIIRAANSVSGGAAGGNEPQMANIQVQLILDGEILQDKLYKTNLRRNS